MGSSIAMIDHHYGHLARDSREHAVSLLDALALERAVDAGWTPTRTSPKPHPIRVSGPSAKAIPQGGGRSVDVEVAIRRPYSKQKQLICREIGKPSDGLEPSTPSLPFLRQLVATDGNGFRAFEPFSRPPHLPRVADGCDPSAP
jgi:hypothetical protein